MLARALACSIGCMHPHVCCCVRTVRLRHATSGDQSQSCFIARHKRGRLSSLTEHTRRSPAGQATQAAQRVGRTHATSPVQVRCIPTGWCDMQAKEECNMHDAHTAPRLANCIMAPCVTQSHHTRLHASLQSHGPATAGAQAAVLA